jgi:hypothetical protein
MVSDYKHMRVTKEDYDRLVEEILSLLKSKGYSERDVSSTQAAWSCFHRAKSYWMYKTGYTDAHIETALRHAFNIDKPTNH